MTRKNKLRNIFPLVQFFVQQLRQWFLWLFIVVSIIVIITPVLPQVNPDARDLVEQSKQYYEQKNYSLAIQKLQQAISIFEQEGDRENQAISLTNLSLLQLASLQTKEALTSLETATDIFNKEGKYPVLVKNLTNLASLQLALGKPDEAWKNFEETTKIYQSLNNRVGWSNSLIYQARALKKLGFYPRACHKLIQAFTLGQDDSTVNQEKSEEDLCKINKNLSAKEISRFVTTISDLWQSERDSQYLDGLRSLGDILRSLGNLEQSKILLEKLVRSDSLREDKVAILLSLAHTYTALGTYEYDLEANPKYHYKPWQYQPLNKKINTGKDYYQKALNNYEEALSRNLSKSVKNKVQLNYLSILIAIGDDFKKAEKIAGQINLSDLPITKSLVDAKIGYARSLAFLEQISNKRINFENNIVALLNEAIKDAQYLQDKQSESIANGNLAGFYEFKGKINKAKELIQKALYLTQPSEAPELAYQWQWQLARLLTEEGKKEEAIDLYQQTKETLNKVRYSLLNIGDDVNFSFRENLAPFYFQYLDLLLGENPTDDNLKEAISVVDLFEKAELENFLRCNLENLSLEKNKLGNNNFIFQNISEFKNPPERIIYPILLEDRIEIIVENPYSENKRQRYAYIFSQDNNISIQEFQDAIFRLPTNLSSKREFSQERKDKIDSLKNLAEKLYDCLIEPIDNSLPEQGTLMFVLDSRLQNIPLAVLFDGKKYLIEKYSITVNLRSQLPKPTTIEKQQYNALLAGISKEAKSYQERLSPLGGEILLELKDISKIVSSQQLRDEEFTEDNLKKKMNANDFNIVHLSTHGEFYPNPDKTLIYAWDKPINANELGEVLKRKAETTIYPIDLLVLSACETAKSKKRAPLGITGVALKSEAHSILASLWQVDSRFTAEFMPKFYQLYQNSEPHYSKAEALREVQMSYLNGSINLYQDPYYWSAFILVGNWL